MSRYLRQSGLWPISDYARYMWQVFSLWEDISILAELHSATKTPGSKNVLERHIIVDFDSLDELLKEFQGYIKNTEIEKLSAHDAEIINSAFIEYHREVQPTRQTQKSIRNYFGAHRTAKPWEKAKKSGINDPKTFGRWEQLLTEIEKQCELSKWIDVFNSAYKLITILKDFNLDSWYRWPDEEKEPQFFFPIHPSGYYKRDPQEY